MLWSVEVIQRNNRCQRETKELNKTSLKAAKKKKKDDDDFENETSIYRTDMQKM